jgi:hypothetical protein
MRSLLDPEEWRRVGPGKGQSFDLATKAVQEVLETSLLQAYRPYFLLAFSMVKRGDVYAPQCEEIRFDQIIEYVDQGVWNFNLGSHVLTPGLVRGPVFDLPDAVLSTNGLINIQCGLKTKKSVQLPSFGIVDKVGNVETYEVLVHKEYLEIFRQLCAAAKAKARAQQC